MQGDTAVKIDIDIVALREASSYTQAEFIYKHLAQAERIVLKYLPRDEYEFIHDIFNNATLETINYGINKHELMQDIITRIYKEIFINNYLHANQGRVTQNMDDYLKHEMRYMGAEIQEELQKADKNYLCRSGFGNIPYIAKYGYNPYKITVNVDFALSMMKNINSEIEHIMCQIMTLDHLRTYQSLNADELQREISDQTWLPFVCERIFKLVCCFKFIEKYQQLPHMIYKRWMEYSAGEAAHPLKQILQNWPPNSKEKRMEFADAVRFVVLIDEIMHAVEPLQPPRF